MSRVSLVVAALAALALAGCKKEEAGGQKEGSRAGFDTAVADAGAPPAGAAGGGAATAQAGEITPEVKKEAEEIFGSRCAACHGPRGAGDGPASAGLTPKPRNFTDPEWQKSVTDAHLENIIAYGGAAVGRSPAMPPNPDLAGKPVIQALRAHVRTLSGAK